MREPTNSLVDPDVEELEALGRVANAFQQYYADAKLEIDRWEWNYSMYVKQVHSFSGTRPFLFFFPLGLQFLSLRVPQVLYLLVG